VDVGAGDAAAGVCIDFYGRYQAQALAEAGDPLRVGYVDPPGESAIDADPVSMLRGAPHPETARRFIEFCLSEAGQALWQFRAGSDDLGPLRHELRRMPVRRVMYERYLDRFIDPVNPFELARPFDSFNAEYWSFIPLLFRSMAIANHGLLSDAWRAIVRHPAYPRAEREIVTAESVDDPRLGRMLELFDAMPEALAPGGRALSLAGPEALAEVRAGWLRGEWADRGLWPADAAPSEVLSARFAEFFGANYKEVLRLAEE
jgi:hypothetical protein